MACLAQLAYWPGPPVPFPGVIFFAGAFAAYALAARALAAAPAANLRPWIWTLAILARALFVARTPVLSDDVYRYLWDGRVQLNGINPYRYPPSAPELEPLRTSWHSLINNADVSTIYPPLAELVFLLIAVLGGTILTAKLVWLILDGATALLLRRVAVRRGLNANLVEFLYLASPLLIIEVAWSAHLEPLGLFALTLLLACAGRPVGAGAAAALAVLAKYAPAAALPPLLRSGGRRFLAVFAVVVAVLYAPYLAAGSSLWSGLQTYVTHWRFNDGAFALVAAVMPSLTAAKLVCGVLLLGVVAWATVARFSAERALFWILGTGLVLSPTVHPWYVLWLLPFAALRRSRPWLLLTGIVFLAYWGHTTFQRTGVWPQPLWARLAIWMPFFVLLAYDALAAPRHGRMAHAG